MFKKRRINGVAHYLSDVREHLFIFFYLCVVRRRGRGSRCFATPLSTPLCVGVFTFSSTVQSQTLTRAVKLHLPRNLHLFHIAVVTRQKIFCFFSQKKSEKMWKINWDPKYKKEKWNVSANCRILLWFCEFVLVFYFVGSVVTAKKEKRC